MEVINPYAMSDDVSINKVRLCSNFIIAVTTHLTFHT